jgi:hypothetical protein
MRLYHENLQLAQAAANLAQAAANVAKERDQARSHVERQGEVLRALERDRLVLARRLNDGGGFSWKRRLAMRGASKLSPLGSPGQWLQTRAQRAWATYRDARERKRTRDASWRPRGDAARRRGEALEWLATRAQPARPDVAVVVPGADGGALLPDLLLSLRAQEGSTFELILVVDGASEATALSLVRDIEGVSGLRLVRLPQRLGPAAARNAGIAQTSAPFIACVDADHVVDPRYLARTVQTLNEDPSLGMVYFDYRKFGRDEDHVIAPEFDPVSLLHDNYIVSSAPFRRAAWEQAGGYWEDLRDGLEDWELWVHFVARGWRARRLPETLFFYRQLFGSHGRSGIELKARVGERIRARHAELYVRLLGDGRPSTEKSSHSSR